jgi:hypothetical protein
MIKPLILTMAAPLLLLLHILPTPTSAAPQPLLRPRTRALLVNGTTNRLAPPTVSCLSATPTSIRVEICPGNNSPAAPYGLKLQWEDVESFVAQGGWCCPGASTDAVCTARTAQAFSSAGDCWDVEIGGGVEPLVTYRPHECGTESLSCGTDYALRAFALGGAAANGSVASSGEVCSTQACPSEPCDDDGDCPPGEECACGFCREFIPECLEDDDCDGALICEAGRCVEPECLVTSDCTSPGETCVAGRCV